MKKILFFVAIMFAVIATSCGKKSADNYADELVSIQVEMLQLQANGGSEEEIAALQEKINALQAEIDELGQNDPEFLSTFQKAVADKLLSNPEINAAMNQIYSAVTFDTAPNDIAREAYDVFVEGGIPEIEQAFEAELEELEDMSYDFND